MGTLDRSNWCKHELPADQCAWCLKHSSIEEQEDEEKSGWFTNFRSWEKK